MLDQKVHQLQAQQVLEAYRQEAEIYGQLPKSSLRRRIALMFKQWAEALEPSLRAAAIEHKTIGA